MLSIPHLIIVFVVALVVFGPEKLPELARNLGKIMGEFKRATGDLRSTFEGHLRDMEREVDQRRIGSSTTSSSALPDVPVPERIIEHEAYPPVLAAGTVPTTPAHVLGAQGPAVESTQAAVDQPDDGGRPGSAVTIEALPSPLDPEHHPETLTDAGTPRT
jgi:sec-independent protein translocase protein TatB